MSHRIAQRPGLSSRVAERLGYGQLAGRLLVDPRRRSQPTRTQRSSSVKIDIAGEHQQSGGDEFVTLPDRASEPPASNDAGAFGPDVIAALSDLAKVVDERLKFGTLRGEECF